MALSVEVLNPALKLNEAELFRLLLDQANQNEYAFALWRLPDTPVKNLILSFATNVRNSDATLEDAPPGFIFAPYDKTKTQYFLNADLLFSFSEGKLNDPQTPRETSSHQWLNDIKNKPTNRKTTAHTTRDEEANPATAVQHYQQLVAESVKHIEAGVFEKIVPSRFKQITLSETFDAIDIFQKLCDTYPNAMVSFISIPQVGTWMGATPEVLIQVENNRIFKTVALAGTKSFEPGTNLKMVAWTQKEIEEQALVSRYIISHLKKIRLREFEEHGPKTIVAGNVMHLKTEFTIDMHATDFPQLGTTMLQLLHPTSAVCGMPLEPALDFLKQHEGYDREFYSGYLGPVNIDNNINIFVNLRCMKLQGNTARIYAGAGVTADSVPEQEWLETETKLNTLLNVIE